MYYLPNLSLFIGVMDLVDKLFIDAFDTVNKESKELLDIVDQQYPFQSLKVSNLKIFWEI